MIRLRYLSSLLLAVCLIGCSKSFHAEKAQTISSAELRKRLTVDTTDHFAYMGSDAKFHYIFHSQLGGGESYRVPIGELALQHTFPVGQGEPYVLTGLHFPSPPRQ